MHRSSSLPAALMTGLAIAATAPAPARGQVIEEGQTLTASDGENGDMLGYTIAFENDFLAAGAPGDDDNGDRSGAAYIFDMNTGTQRKLVPADNAATDEFGYAVAMDNGIVAVGAPGNSGLNHAGAVYLFDAATGTQLHKLISDDDWSEFFGTAVALDNGIVAIGAFWEFNGNNVMSGAVHLYDAATGVHLRRLTASDGEFDDRFGFSVAIDNGIVAVGAIGDDDTNFWAGSAYLFDVATGTQLAKLLHGNGEVFDQLGSSITLDNGIVAVGAIGTVDPANPGSVVLFDAATGAQLAELVASDSHAGNDFGAAVSMSNGALAVGARLDDAHGHRAGAAYLFDVTTGEQLVKLLPSDGWSWESFGASIVIDNGMVVVGKPPYGPWNNSSGPGAAYIYDITICYADLTGDGVANTQDFLAFLNEWANNSAFADWNVDGVVDTQDFLAYLNDWATGC